MPVTGDDLTLYQRRVAEARAVGLGMTRTQSLAFVGILENYAEELAKRVSRGVSTRGEQFALREAREIISSLADELEDSTHRGIALTAERVALIHAAATRDLMAAGGVMVGTVLSGIGTSAAQAVSSRKQLSGSFVSIRRGAVMQTDQVIKAAFLQGVKGPQLAMQLRTMIVGATSLPTSLVLDRRRIGKKAMERMGLAPTPENVRMVRRRAGFIANRANLIARSEPMNAEWEAHVQGVISSPITDGIKWNLSGRHPEPDICDDLATTDWYGLGPGNYPARGIPPRPHPRCICFHTDRIRPIKDWFKPKGIAARRQNPLAVALGNGRPMSAARALENAFAAARVHETRLAELPSWEEIQRRVKTVADLGGHIVSAAADYFNPEQLNLNLGALALPKQIQGQFTTDVGSIPAGVLPWIKRIFIEDPGGPPGVPEMITGILQRFGHQHHKRQVYQVVDPQSLYGRKWKVVNRETFGDALYDGEPVRIQWGPATIKNVILNEDNGTGAHGIYNFVNQELFLSEATVSRLIRFTDRAWDSKPADRRRWLTLFKETANPDDDDIEALFDLAEGIDGIQTIIHEMMHSRSPESLLRGVTRNLFVFNPYALDLEEGITQWTAAKMTAKAFFARPDGTVDPAELGRDLWRIINEAYPVRAAVMQRLDAFGRRGALQRVWRETNESSRMGVFLEESIQGMELFIRRQGITKSNAPETLEQVVKTMRAVQQRGLWFHQDYPRFWDAIRDYGQTPGHGPVKDASFAAVIRRIRDDLEHKPGKALSYDTSRSKPTPKIQSFLQAGPDPTLADLTAGLAAEDLPAANKYSRILFEPAKALYLPLRKAILTVPDSFQGTVTDEVRRTFALRVMEAVGAARLPGRGFHSLLFNDPHVINALAEWRPGGTVALGRIGTQALDMWIQKIAEGPSLRALRRWVEAGTDRLRSLATHQLIHEAGHTITPAHRMYGLALQGQAWQYGGELEEGFNTLMSRRWLTQALYGNTDWEKLTAYKVFKMDFAAYNDYVRAVQGLISWSPARAYRAYVADTYSKRIQEMSRAMEESLLDFLKKAIGASQADLDLIALRWSYLPLEEKWKGSRTLGLLNTQAAVGYLTRNIDAFDVRRFLASMGIKAEVSRPGGKYLVSVTEVER